MGLCLADICTILRSSSWKHLSSNDANKAYSHSDPPCANWLSSSLKNLPTHKQCCGLGVHALLLLAESQEKVYGRADDMKNFKEESGARPSDMQVDVYTTRHVPAHSTGLCHHVQSTLEPRAILALDSRQAFNCALQMQDK